MFLPNLKCRIQKSASKDVYAQSRPGRYVTERCAIVKLVVVSDKTSVRADSSASRGNSREVEISSVILLEATTQANIDDILEVAGARLQITGKSPRYDVAGRLDHYEITAQIWSKK